MLWKKNEDAERSEQVYSVSYCSVSVYWKDFFVLFLLDQGPFKWGLRWLLFLTSDDSDCPWVSKPEWIHRYLHSIVTSEQ